MLKPECVQMSAASIKQSHNNLLPTSKHPSFLNLHTAKHGDLIELSVDRFSLLTKQPKSVEHLNLYNLGNVESDVRKRRDYAVPMFQKFVFPRATPLSFKWNAEHMPRIKVRKPNRETKNAYDDATSWKQMLYMNEKNAAEREQERRNERQAMSKEFESGSIRKLKKIRENYKKALESATSDENKARRHDIWTSDNSKDVRLSKETIEMMYSTENRRIRHGRQENPNFFRNNTNDIFDKMHKLTIAAKETAHTATPPAPAVAVSTTTANTPTTAKK